MRSFALLFCLLISSAAARADIRYQVWPSYGEMRSFGRSPRPGDCPSDVQLQLWRALAHHPVVTIHASGKLDISFNFDMGEKIAEQITASTQTRFQGKVIGRWASKMPGLSFTVAIMERRQYVPIIEVSLDMDVARPDGTRLTCSETWSGLADKF